MRYSSARQLTLNFDAASPTDLISSGLPSDAPAAPSEPLRLPGGGGGYGPVYAATSRIAGRINAANISDMERDKLLQERQKLLDKKLNGTITRKESNRLEYVRWSLDRIEDARHGGALEILDSSVSRYEQILADLLALKKQLDAQLPTRKG